MYSRLNLIKYPLITSKIRGSMKKNLKKTNYSFLVDFNLNKKDIKNMIEYFFNVNIYKITLTTIPEKKICTFKYPGFKSKYKKATIYIKAKKKRNIIHCSISN
uniref:Ribosomal protein L23 n=1 Tax=Nitzschia sp. IriIs04 TaxID=1444690 RepID=A0A0S3QPQ3_9STRA|nr:ribosomal protein L23 [Nitzschia sp. IriIs04]BAT70309.1 ribosomal protein L23 [Nitzschia sp. IriIs04]